MAGALVLSCSAGVAGSTRFCDRQAEVSTAQQDRLFRFAALVKDELDRSGAQVALVSRSGLDLERFGVRYSHAGISLRDSDNAPWSVRQLYYACDEQRPRVFDQGMSGFVLGTDDPDVGFLSVVLLPSEAEPAVARTALDKAQVLDHLSGVYSANAYAFSDRYQNCNQWLIELLATAWRRREPEADPGRDASSGAPVSTRQAAQQWLQSVDYRPSDMPANPLVRLFVTFSPWLHSDDHPDANLAAGVYRVNMPASIEAFVRQREPQARRIEFCHRGKDVVVHEGWTPIERGCVAGPGDRVVTLN